MLTSTQRVAIFWGGGLGDILVLRPMLLGLGARLAEPPTLFTTAQHLPGLLAELNLRVQLRSLPRAPRAALLTLRAEPLAYDLLYLGPYPTLRTRLLATAMRSAARWSKRHPDADIFVAEQILADVRDFGLDEPAEIHRAYGGDWLPQGYTGTEPLLGDYLVLHPGAKDGWKTKQWPDASWVELMDRLLQQTSLHLVLTGVPAELRHMQDLVKGMKYASRRVGIRADLSLPGLAGLIRASAGVICHNSGILHLSALLGRPTIALTGASATFWRPPYAHVRNLTSGACKLACNQYQCPVPFFRAKCIRELPVKKVVQTACEFLVGR